ncbi:S41 family peptidase [Flavobacterium limi]|uniref:Tail specific protease domain-containing protein n=1 Tax=Flavobacterium limi TaxID=2045105 RepID=A0ABQ1UXL3_9FLAO|nr:S41 family peptidase [Flavobacterium limi]GGF28661.1 hypothetical protein GCM10011518_42510 [Flavobacterium limi]
MRIALIFIFFFWTIVSNAQTNTYLADLTALKTILQKTPSFKAQITGNKLAYYNTLYIRLASDTLSKPNSYIYFYNLSQLLFPLRDNHLGFYELPNYNDFKTKESIDRFTETKEFLNYPTSKINIDSLKTELLKKSTNSIEGIYYYDKFYSVGLFKSADKEYIGVVVDSDTKLWVKGQIAIHLYEYAPNLYKAIYGHPLYKSYILQTNEKYQNQSLINSYFYASYSQSIYSKQRQQMDYANLPKGSPKFELKNIHKDVQYLLIRTFQVDAATKEKSQQFYNSIQDSLKAPYVVLDLRNNEGGAEKEMKKFFLLLKKYVNHGRLYVLINNSTLSQAEIFTLALKKLANVITVGQTTKGMLTYGSNYGRRERLPSVRFEIYPTDMKGDEKFLQYEDYGITPDIVLRTDIDWIEQVIEVVQKN